MPRVVDRHPGDERDDNNIRFTLVKIYYLLYDDLFVDTINTVQWQAHICFGNRQIRIWISSNYSNILFLINDSRCYVNGHNVHSKIIMKRFHYETFYKYLRGSPIAVRSGRGDLYRFI